MNKTAQLLLYLICVKLHLIELMYAESISDLRHSQSESVVFVLPKMKTDIFKTRSGANTKKQFESEKAKTLSRKSKRIR